MSAWGVQLEQLLADQRRDGLAVDGALLLSNWALAAGLLDVAEDMRREADAIMVRIRLRSRAMADLLDGVEHRLAAVATDSADG